MESGINWPEHLACENFSPDNDNEWDFCPTPENIQFPENVSTITTPTALSTEATSRPASAVEKRQVATTESPNDSASKSSKDPKAGFMLTLMLAALSTALLSLSATT
jgi:hypothetical protein